MIWNLQKVKKTMIFILSVLPMVRIISYLYYMLEEQRKALVRTLLIFPCVCMFLFFSHFFFFFFLSGFLFDNFCNYYHCMNDVMIVITTITIAIITIIIIIIIIIIKIMIITIILMIKIMITMVIVVSINQTYFMLFLCYLL